MEGELVAAGESGGRLELAVENGRWGSICDDGLEGPEAAAAFASVACRALGFAQYELRACGS